MTILMRPIFVPIGEVKTATKPLPVIVSTEWHRTIEQLVQATNSQADSIAGLAGAGTTGDVLVNDADRRLILRDEDGRYWQLSVDTDGALFTTDLGTSI